MSEHGLYRCDYCGQFFNEDEGYHEKEHHFWSGRKVTLYRFICGNCEGIREVNAIGREK